MKCRPSTPSDLPAIVALLEDDPLGRTRESQELARYEGAMAQIDASPDNEVYVVEQPGPDGPRIVGTFQLTIIPNLSRSGTKRAQIEGVRVASDLRGTGLGRDMIAFAIERAREAGCGLVQLTCDKSRPDAIRFYESLGFEASHEGMKKEIRE